MVLRIRSFKISIHTSARSNNTWSILLAMMSELFTFIGITDLNPSSSILAPSVSGKDIERHAVPCLRNVDVKSLILNPTISA